MYKIIVGEEFIKSDKLQVASPTVIPLDNYELIKTATISEIVDFIRNIPKDPDKTKLLVIAMGASDFYGPNKNGDYFAEEELLPAHTTFEDAHFFRHHINKDPAKSYGNVLKSFYNDKMHRVELIIDIINAKAPETVQKIKQGVPIAVSMGCRVKYDICSICGNEAPTRGHYCDHAKFQMCEIMSDGKQVWVYNPNPKFFDISEVFRPADRMGWSIKKVAQVNRKLSADFGEIVEQANLKSSAIKKTNDILKKLKGVAFNADDIEKIDEKFLKYLPTTHIDKMSVLDEPSFEILIRLPINRAVSTCQRLGVPLTTPELTGLLSPYLKGIALPELCTASKITDDIMPARPDLAHLIDKLFLSGAPDQESAEKLISLAEKRSLIPQHIYSLLSGDKPSLRIKILNIEQKDPDVDDLGKDKTAAIGKALLILSTNKHLPNLFTKVSENISRITAGYLENKFNKSKNINRRFPILQKIATVVRNDYPIESVNSAIPQIEYYSNLLGEAFLTDLRN